MSKKELNKEELEKVDGGAIYGNRGGNGGAIYNTASIGGGHDETNNTNLDNMPFPQDTKMFEGNNN